MRRIATKVETGELKASEISEGTLAEHLFIPSIPDVDLLIRTSGEQRISNFMPWHLSYAELYFTSQYWPDFTPAHLHEALADFRSRERRYGEVKSPDNYTQIPALENNLC